MPAGTRGGRISLRLELDRRCSPPLRELADQGSSEPIRGRLVAADGSQEEFSGWLALAAAIERAAVDGVEVK